MDLLREQEMAAKEKCAQAARESAALYRQKQWTEYGDDRRETEPDTARLARILRRESAHEPAGRGRMDTSPTPSHVATATKAPSLRAHAIRPFPMAQPLVWQARAGQS